MSLYYADTSALVRAYFDDEPDHGTLRRLLLEGAEPVVTSTLARVELASAVAAAARAGRLDRPRLTLDRFDADCANGPVTLLSLDSEEALPLAYRLVAEYPLHSLDAIHLAVAMTKAAVLAAGERLVLVTRDGRQAEAAQALGLEVA